MLLPTASEKMQLSKNSSLFLQLRKVRRYCYSANCFGVCIFCTQEFCMEVGVLTYLPLKASCLLEV